MQSDKCNGTQHVDHRPYMYRIINDFIEDAVWELCFEVHRAAKLGYLFLESEEENSEIVEDEKKDIFGQPLKSKVQTFQIPCPICSNKSCATKFASHLAKCIGIGGRNSSRAASKKIAEQNSSTILDDFDVEADREEQRALEAKRRRAKPRVVKINDMQEMTRDKRQKFFNKFCGVETKKGSKLCTKPPKCTQHTEEEKKIIRSTFLDDSNQCENEHIDVDTIPEENMEAPSQQPWFYDSIPNNSIPENIKQEVFPYPAGMWPHS